MAGEAGRSSIAAQDIRAPPSTALRQVQVVRDEVVRASGERGGTVPRTWRAKWAWRSCLLVAHMVFGAAGRRGDSSLAFVPGRLLSPSSTIHYGSTGDQSASQPSRPSD